MEIEFAYWFANLPGIHRRKLFRMLEYVEDEEEIYRMKARDLQVFENVLSAGELEALKRSRNTWDIYREYEKLGVKGIDFYYYGGPGFPQRLLQIPDAPYALYVRGKLPAEDIPAVAVIGARECTEYGRSMASYFAGGLTDMGAAVVSGMARGIDGLAQSACLAAGGRSYGVLGCGVDVCYPACNRQIYEQLPLHGGLVSEYPPGTAPQARLFPPRNRLISGLSDAVLVVEARERSGTLITVDMALEQGRDVYVVPGRVGDTLSKGCLRLVKQGADIALEPADILTGVRDGMPMPSERPDGPSIKQPAAVLTAEEHVVWRCLDYMPVSLETLAAATGYVLPKLLQHLLALQLKGAAAESGKGYYVRCG